MTGKTSDTKMLQAILDRIAGLSKKIDKVDQKVEKGFKRVDKRFDMVDERMDKFGLDLAELSDDAPTVEEFDQLEDRVDKVEKQIVSG